MVRRGRRRRRRRRQRGGILPFLVPLALAAGKAIAAGAVRARGTRKGKIPPRCRRRLRLRRTMMPMERDRERTLFL